MKVSALAAIACAGSAVAQSTLSLTQALASRPDLSSLTGLVGNVSGLAAQLGMMNNITLLAPSNSAIAAALNSSTGMMLASNPSLLQAVLTYHVIQGSYPSPNMTAFLRSSLTPGMYANVTGGQRVEVMPMNGSVNFFSGLLQNSSVVANGTIPFSGGVIHVINRLLTLPANITTTGVAANLTSAVGALSTLNLTQAISSQSDLTLFIPSNNAFQAIGGSLANLSTSQLTGILTYHAAKGVLYSTDIQNGTMVPSLGGGNLTLRVVGSGTSQAIYVNNARVLRSDVLVANGVVHVIDRVLNPNNTSQMPNTATTEQAFAGATSASNVPFTSGVPTPTSAVATSRASSASSSAGAIRALETGAMAMAAMFGGVAAAFNI